MKPLETFIVFLALTIPYVHNLSIRNSSYRPVLEFFFAAFYASFILLVWNGFEPTDDFATYFNMAAVVAAVYAFLFHLIFNQKKS